MRASGKMLKLEGLGIPLLCFTFLVCCGYYCDYFYYYYYKLLLLLLLLSLLLTSLSYFPLICSQLLPPVFIPTRLGSTFTCQLFCSEFLVKQAGMKGQGTNTKSPPHVTQPDHAHHSGTIIHNRLQFTFKATKALISTCINRTRPLIADGPPRDYKFQGLGLRFGG